MYIYIITNKIDKLANLFKFKFKFKFKIFCSLLFILLNHFAILICCNIYAFAIVIYCIHYTYYMHLFFSLSLSFSTLFLL